MEKQYRRTVVSCYIAYVVQAIVINLAPILFTVFYDEFGLTLEQLGRLTLINFLAQIVTDIVASGISDRIGVRKACLLSQVTVAAGLVCMSLLPDILPSPYSGLVIATILYAFGGGLVEIMINPLIEAIPSKGNGVGLALLHSFYSWGQVITIIFATFLVWLLGSANWRLIPLIFTVLPIVCVVGFLRGKLPPVAQGDERESIRSLFSAPIFYIAIILMLCSGAAEQAISQWASLFAERGLGIDKLTGDLLGPCLFALCMAIARAAYGLLGKKLDIKKALFFGGVLCVACYLVTALSKSSAISLFGCVMCGFAVSLMWPGVLSFTSTRFPAGGTMMFAVLALAGDTGASIGPWLTGVVSDVSQRINPELFSSGGGLRAGILSALIFPIIFLVCFLVMGRMKTKE